MCGDNTIIKSPLRIAVQQYEAQVALSERISAKIIEKETDLIGVVKSTIHDVHIPANTEMSVVRTTNQQFNDHMVLVEPSDFPIPEGLVIVPSVDKIHKGTVGFRLMNFSHTNFHFSNPTPTPVIYL
jgi:hypothetical protein